MRGYSTGAVASPAGRLRRSRLLPLAMPVHQLIDARLKAARAVGKEAEFGHVAHPHPFLELIADVALGGFQASHCLFFGFGNVLDGAVHGHIHPRRLAAGIQRHLGDIAEIDARVHQLALDEHADLHAQRLRHAVLMVLPSSVLRHDSLS